MVKGESIHLENDFIAVLRYDFHVFFIKNDPLIRGAKSVTKPLRLRTFSFLNSPFFSRRFEVLPCPVGRQAPWPSDQLAGRSWGQVPLRPPAELLLVVVPSSPSLVRSQTDYWSTKIWFYQRS